MDGARVEGRVGVGEGVRAAGKDLTLIGLTNRHIRLALSRGEMV